MYNILGYLIFAVAIEMPFIAYREPRGGLQGWLRAVSDMQTCGRWLAAEEL